MATLSVGIAVGQYTTHLQQLLGRARDQERAAKNGPRKDGGRNALAVAVYTGDSTSDVSSIVHSWADDPVNNRWNIWIDWYRRKAISHQTGYQLRDLIAEYQDIRPDLLTTRRYSGIDRGFDRGYRAESSLLEREVLHILESKQPGDDGERMTDADIDVLLSTVQNSTNGLTVLAEELIAARHFAAASTIATGRVAEGATA